VIPPGVTENQGGMTCRVCGEEDCVRHRDVLMLAQAVNVVVGLAALLGSIAVAWTWATRGSTF
jgi:hypothetical protein